MELYKRLQHLRKLKGYTQQTVGEQFNVSRQAIQKWESGETSPDISKLHDLSIFYDVSLDVLLDESLTEEQFKNIILNQSYKDELTTSNIISILKKPSKLDLIITGVMIFSTVFVTTLIHLFGILLVFIAVVLILALGLSGIYFLINALTNFSNGFNVIIINLGISSLSIGLLLFLYSRVKKIVLGYISYAKKITNRLRLYIKLVKAVQDEK